MNLCQTLVSAQALTENLPAFIRQKGPISYPKAEDMIDTGDIQIFMIVDQLFPRQRTMAHGFRNDDVNPQFLQFRYKIIGPYSTKRLDIVRPLRGRGTEKQNSHE
jgi:hypothetical protein